MVSQFDERLTFTQFKLSVVSMSDVTEIDNSLGPRKSIQFSRVVIGCASGDRDSTRIQPFIGAVAVQLNFNVPRLIAIYGF